MEDFDPTKVDAAVDRALGRKPAQAKAPTAGPSLEGLNPDLSQRLQQARDAYKQRFGKDLQITSGVRTREEQQSLYNRWKSGEKGVYEPINPADYPNQTTFHTNAVDIATTVPESFLNEFGIHRPMGTKDPVHAVVMPKAPPLKAPEVKTVDSTGIENIDKLMNPEAINAAVDTAMKEPPKKGKVATKVSSLFGDLTASAAGLADTVIGGIQSFPGMAVAETGYATGRALQSLGVPIDQGRLERGRTAIYKQFVEPYQRPVGEALGVTESPAYKAEASQALMQFVGENINKGADWISKTLGIPKADAENMINTLLVGSPGIKGTKVGQAIGREVGYVTEAAKQAGGKVLGAVGEVTPGPIRRAAAGTVEAIAPGTIKPKPVAPVTVPQPANVPPFQTGRVSVGAAAVPDATTIQQALTSATPEFQQLYGKMPLDKVNTPVVLRHLEADALPIPIRLTEGQATGDVVKLSREQNLRGSQPEFARRFNEQNQQLVENVPLIREQAAPDVYATKTIESSQAIIDAYKKLDQERNAAIDAKYTELREAAGGELPVDAKTLLKNIDDRLKKELLTTDGQSISQYKELKALSGAFDTMTFDNYLAMRRNLSRLSAESKDGNIRQAAGLMVQELDKLPLSGETAALKPLADEARALARSRFDALKKDPAYKAAVDDVVSADKYFNKFVINGDRKNINTMIDTLGRDSLAHQHMRAGTINHLSDKAGIVDGRGNFSQANYNKALKQLDDFKKFETIFDPESQLQLRTLGNVASYTQFQPRGSFVNNSNTLVGYLANKAAGGLEAAGNVAGLKTFGYPIGSEARRVIRSARERREAEAALKPGAGSTLKDISEGKK